MSFCVICLLHLEGSHNFSLNSLMALLAIITVSGSKTLQPVVLTLIIYTISLRLSTINTCFLQNFPTVSRLLHVVPLLGISCMASVELISGLQSPAAATAGILLGALPLATLIVRHGRRCTETLSAAGLPVQMQDVSVPAAPISADTPPVSSQTERAARAIALD